MYQSDDRQDFEGARQKVIENALYIGQHPTQEALALQRHSLHKTLVTDVVQAALQHCLSTGQDVTAKFKANSAPSISSIT
jgi:hypothetical protein